MDITLLKKIIWPINKHEIPKFKPLAIMMFCCLFNYTLLRALKDSLIISEIGVEATNFVKLWGVLPCAFIFTLVYTKLSNHFSQTKVFYIISAYFLLVFIFFTYIIYPWPEIFNPDQIKIKELSEAHPHFKWFILLTGQWSYVIIYITAELWSNAVTAILFWQFANQICAKEEAIRFYPTLGIIANIAVITAGYLIELIVTFEQSLSYNFKASGDILVFSIMSLVILVTIIFIYTYSRISKNYHNKKIPNKTASVSSSLKLVLTSKYILLLMITVICYSITINLVENPWKAVIKEVYFSAPSYANFMGTLLKWTGITSLIFMIIGSNILRFFGWYISIIITPIIILTTGILFYIIDIFYKEYLIGIGIEGLKFLITLGLIQNVLARSSKHSLFDPTKEIAFIPLDVELRTKGKAVVDVIGRRFGESAGALIQFFIFTIFPDYLYQDIITYLMVCFISVGILWIWSVVALNKEYKLYKQL